ITAVRGEGGGVRCLAKLLRDETARKRAEDERRACVDALAHDLRNPLTAAHAWTDLLRRRLERGGTDPAAIGEGLGEIEASIGRATALLHDLLDAARLDAAEPSEPDLASVDLVGLVLEAAAFQGTAGHLLRVDAATDELRGLWGGRRLERAVTNLFSNATKYSPAGAEGAGTHARAARPSGALGGAPP